MFNSVIKKVKYLQALAVCINDRPDPYRPYSTSGHERRSTSVICPGNGNRSGTITS